MNKLLFVFLINIASPLSADGLDSYIHLKGLKHRGACKGCKASFWAPTQKKWLRLVTKHQIENGCKRGPIVHKDLDKIRKYKKIAQYQFLLLYPYKNYRR